MKKKICMILCLVWSFIMLGCSADEKGSQMNVYYMNMDGNALVQQEYFRKANESEDAIQEVLEIMKKSPDLQKFQSAIPKNVDVESIHLNSDKLELSFSASYLEMAKSADVLLRAAVVQTMVQIPNVNYVSFYVEGEPLKDSTGSVIGLMCAEDFVQNTGSSLKTYQQTNLKLYFANKEGTKLAQEKHSDVRYSINTSVEKLVVEQLMKGPSSDKKYATIPQTVKLLGVSVKEGICYVNFDSAFLTEGYNQKPEIAIYSIVNSIIENGNAIKVQILIDGSSDIKYKGTIDLSEPLAWKAKLIEETNYE